MKLDTVIKLTSEQRLHSVGIDQSKGVGEGVPFEHDLLLWPTSVAHTIATYPTLSIEDSYHWPTLIEWELTINQRKNKIKGLSSYLLFPLWVSNSGGVCSEFYYSSQLRFLCFWMQRFSIYVSSYFLKIIIIPFVTWSCISVIQLWPFWSVWSFQMTSGEISPPYVPFLKRTVLKCYNRYYKMFTLRSS